MKFLFAFALSVGFLCVQPAVAADKPEPAINANSKAAFDTVAEWIRKQMEGGGRYADTNAAERATVNRKLDTMGKLFEGHDDTKSMSDGDKLTLFNSQEEINGILAKRDGQRLICKNERPVGSNIPVRTCKTAQEIEDRKREDTRDFRRRQDVQPQLRGG